MLNPRFSTVTSCCLPRISSHWSDVNSEHASSIWCVISRNTHSARCDIALSPHCPECDITRSNHMSLEGQCGLWAMSLRAECVFHVNTHFWCEIPPTRIMILYVEFSISINKKVLRHQQSLFMYSVQDVSAYCWGHDMGEHALLYTENQYIWPPFFN